jgi:hypothetical protein
MLQSIKAIPYRRIRLSRNVKKIKKKLKNTKQQQHYIIIVTQDQQHLKNLSQKWKTINLYYCTTSVSYSVQEWPFLGLSKYVQQMIV